MTGDDETRESERVINLVNVLYYNFPVNYHDMPPSRRTKRDASIQAPAPPHPVCQSDTYKG
jgi:hypothetical protein